MEWNWSVICMLKDSELEAESGWEFGFLDPWQWYFSVTETTIAFPVKWSFRMIYIYLCIPESGSDCFCQLGTNQNESGTSRPLNVVHQLTNTNVLCPSMHKTCCIKWPTKLWNPNRSKEPNDIRDENACLREPSFAAHRMYSRMRFGGIYEKPQS